MPGSRDHRGLQCSNWTFACTRRRDVVEKSTVPALTETSFFQQKTRVMQAPEKNNPKILEVGDKTRWLRSTAWMYDHLKITYPASIEY